MVVVIEWFLLSDVIGLLDIGTIWFCNSEVFVFCLFLLLPCPRRMKGGKTLKDTVVKTG